jgi:Protein of unknown function (DUF4231)
VFRQKPYLASLKKDLNERIIENKKLELDDLHKEFLRLRWLDQVLWMEERAKHTKVLYYILRITMIIFSAIIPVLVGSRLFTGDAIAWVTGVVFVLSLLVAIGAALDEFLRYGERWRHYRLKVELLKNEGWLFLQLAGRHYKEFSWYAKGHAEAYPRFAQRVEKWNRLEVDEYLTQVVQDTGDEDEPP